MKTITEIKEIKAEIKALKSKGRVIGFVPTMGYLHEGHLSLVRESVKTTDCTVVSIFINPTQFGPKEDFKEYPRDLKRDSEILEEEGVDYLFVPETNQMYPKNYKTYVSVHDLEDKLCGCSRPEHFRGVCTIVLKLFNIVNPDISFFGQKDAQQAIILKRMVRDLDLDVKIQVLPIVREKDGLAISSRNFYLSPEQRQAALILSKSLRDAQKMIDNGERESERIVKRMRDMINSEHHVKIDYIEIVGPESLEPLSRIENGAFIALAVFIDNVRFIDNIFVQIKE